MNLFDYVDRTDLDPRGNAEPLFTHLNRSARPGMERIRCLLEDWFDQFPDTDKADLCSRFRTNHDDHHLGAFFELYCCALLQAQRFAVVVHPTADTENRTHPDFLVSKDDSPRFYMECALAMKSRGNDRAEGWLDEVHDTLDKMESPDFFIDMEVGEPPKQQLSPSRIRAFIAQKLQGLDPDAIGRLWLRGDLEGVPTWVYREGGSTLIFRPLPKSDRLRGKSGVRTVGIRSSGFREVDNRTSVFNSLRKKAKRYGDLGLPYVVAINALECWGEIDIQDALMGTERCVCQPGSKPRRELAPDGLWHGPQGPRNRKVSAALIVTGLHWSQVARQTPVVWHNPWAYYPLPPGSWAGPQMVHDAELLAQDRIRWVAQPGNQAAELLGLDPDWP